MHWFEWLNQWIYQHFYHSTFVIKIIFSRSNVKWDTSVILNSIIFSIWSYFINCISFSSDMNTFKISEIIYKHLYGPRRWMQFSSYYATKAKNNTQCPWSPKFSLGLWAFFLEVSFKTWYTANLFLRLHLWKSVVFNCVAEFQKSEFRYFVAIFNIYLIFMFA